MNELPNTSSSMLASGGSPLAISTAVIPSDQMSACKEVYYGSEITTVSKMIIILYDHLLRVGRLQGPSGGQTQPL